MARLPLGVHALHDFAGAHRLTGKADARNVSIAVEFHAEILNAERAFDFGHAHFIREHVYVSVCHVDLHSVQGLGGVFVWGIAVLLCGQSR